MSDKKNANLKVSGSDGFGNAHNYQFCEVDALTGLTVMHEYGSLLVHALPQVTALFEAYEKLPVPENPDDDDRIFEVLASGLKQGDSSPFVSLLKLFPQILTTTRLLDLCKTFLAVGSVDGDECDESGMCDAFKGRPHEVYVALFWALSQNFPDYFGPFLDALNEGDDTTASQ